MVTQSHPAMEAQNTDGDHPVLKSKGRFSSILVWVQPQCHKFISFTNATTAFAIVRRAFPEGKDGA